jgi:ketosteroid isomerase-like protein
MAGSKLDLVGALLDRLERAGPDAALELLSEDFVIEVPPSLSAEPDVYEGHAGALRYFRGFDGMMEDVRFEPLELIEEGEHVIARLRLTGRGVSSGIEVAQAVVVVIAVEAGKVASMRAYPDLDSAREALRELG